MRVGDTVAADTVVARTDLPGKAFPINVAHELSLLPDEVPEAMTVSIGQSIAKGEVLATTRSLFGLFKSEVRAPTGGTIEAVSHISGQVLLREPPLPVVVAAYLAGTVVEEMPGEGVVVETEGAFVQGIFGLAGETHAPLRTIARSPDQTVDAGDIPDDATGYIIVAGGLLTLDALLRCVEVRAAGVVTGGFAYADIHELLGADIGVAVTGQENLPTTLVVTEGFGRIPMARATFELLAAHAGEAASMNGATQIRAGVIRPEIVVPHRNDKGQTVMPALGLAVGAAVRCIRTPYFGRIGGGGAVWRRRGGHPGPRQRRSHRAGLT